MSSEKITPGVLVNTLRENQNNNKTLRSMFANQFLGKLNYEELEGLKKGIDKELGKRSNDVIRKQIEFLEKHGYKVKK